MKNILIALIPFLLFSHQVHAECIEPALPVFPQGSSATQEDMENSELDHEVYMENARAFLNCLEEEEQAAVADGLETNETKTARDNRHQSAVDNIKSVAAEFLLQVEAFETSQ